MAEIRSLEQISQEIAKARETIRALEDEMHAVAVAAYLCFISQKDPNNRGMIPVGEDRRINFPAVGTDLACCIFEDDIGRRVRVGLRGDTAKGIGWQGRSVAIDGKAELVMFTDTFFFTLAAFSSKNQADAWLANASPIALSA
ncbi:MAG: hypothetical protein WC477_07015 [Patescibacteria group bacterium]